MCYRFRHMINTNILIWVQKVTVLKWDIATSETLVIWFRMLLLDVWSDSLTENNSLAVRFFVFSFLLFISPASPAALCSCGCCICTCICNMMSINLFVIGKALLSRNGGAAACAAVGRISCCCCGTACGRPVFRQSKKLHMLPKPGLINCWDYCRLHCAVCELWDTYCSPSVVVPGMVAICLNWIADGMLFSSFAT